MSPQYDELGPTSGWDRFVSLRHPGNFNGFRVLAALLHGTVVVGVSQTAALNRARHLYSAGRPSRWALAHIFSVNNKFHPADLSQQSRTMSSDERLATFSIGSKQWRRQNMVWRGHKTTWKLFVAYKMTGNNTANKCLERQPHATFYVFFTFVNVFIVKIIVKVPYR